jgi:CheY-like chemotaxis protein
VVAVSGYAQPDDVARARGAGFDDHLAKPVTRGSLQAVLASVAAAPGAAASGAAAPS